MGHLKTESIRLNNYNEDKVDIKYDVRVNKAGYFTTTLPEPWGQQLYNEEIHTGRSRNCKAGYFEANTLDNLNTKVSSALKALVSKELLEERIVLRYNIETIASYCINQSGEIVPNGDSHWGFKDNNYKWYQGTLDNPAHSPKPYGIQIWVCPQVKKTFKYRNGNIKHTYDRVESLQGDEKIKYPNLHWLNSLCAMAPVHQSHIQEIDYDEVVAGFFVNMVKGLCNINEKIRDFLSPEAIKIFANKDVKFLR